MSDTPAPTPSARPSLYLRTQCIKDLSFENPRAPAALFQLREAPQIEVSVNLGAARLDTSLYEVGLHITVRATANGGNLFLCDLLYAGVIEVRNLPEAEIEPALYIQGAQLIYPFARRVISDVTRDGGFPPVTLEPLDFAGMYFEQKKKAPASATATAS